MDFKKADKGFVLWWIDRQFVKNSHFPAHCCSKTSGGSSHFVTKEHIKAYHHWRAVPFKRKAMLEWVNRWLGDGDQKLLLEAIEQNNHYKGMNRSA